MEGKTGDGLTGMEWEGRKAGWKDMRGNAECHWFLGRYRSPFFLRFLFVLTIGASIDLSKQSMESKAGQWRTECVFGLFCFLFL